MKNKLFTFVVFGFLATLNQQPTTGFAQVASINSFTYQGRLNDANGPVNGLYDFNFALFNASTGGSQIGTPVTRTFLPVTNGLFTVPLEFPDAASFSGADRWLEIAVHPSGVGTNTTLSPRQQITAAPYAIKAKEATTVPAGTITGAMLADGAVSAAKMQYNAALQNILASGSAAVTPGGVVMSDDPTNLALTAQGYVRMPNAETTLAAEKWTKLNPPAANTEYIPGAGRELLVNAGSELLVFRFHYFGFDVTGADYQLRLLETIRYNPATGQWSKGAAPPYAVVADGATAVWTGSKVIIWGGEEIIVSGSGYNAYVDYANPTNALVYTPATDQWTIVAGTGAIPEGRRLHSAIWTGSRMLVWGGEKVAWKSQGWGGDYIREDLNTGASFDPNTGAWTAISTNAAPSKRRGHATVWTGSRMVVQGGARDNRSSTIGGFGSDDVALSSTNVFNNGASYNPANDTWSPIRSDSSAPRQAFAQAVWTGSEMFTFGGVDVNYVTSYDPNYGNLTQWLWVPERTGRSYHLTNDFWTWRGIPDGSGPNINGRRYGTLAWTGSEVIACGGEGLNETNYFPYARADGQAYNMSSGTWRTLPAAPLGGGVDSQSTWMGNQLFVSDPAGSARAAYSPSSNSWSVLPNYFGPTPLKQNDPSAIWTGKEMIIWGGLVNGVVSNRGRRYNPTTALWTEISTTNAPSARMRHSAVWTGSRMIVWGGDGGGDPLYPAVVYSTGGAYDPVTDTWTALPAAPFDPLFQDVFHRTGHKAVWTIYGMIVAGGSDGYNGQGTIFPKTIARLSPNLTSWTLSSDTDSLLARFGHCLGTDGVRRVFLWGGHDQPGQNPIGAGMLIDAFNLSAHEVDNAEQPAPTRNSSIVWSRTEFIVWGGTGASGQPVGGGGKFDPTIEYWESFPFSGPVITTAHAGHAAVWSGTEMLLWGGSTNQFGVRFNPRNDGWNPMAIGPVMRAGGRGEWTGNNMLIYLPALPAQGSIPELWQYQPPSKVYYYLKQ
jgi:hypothetical protein